jgi:hypothetical protein
MGFLSSVHTPRKDQKLRLERNDLYLPDVQKMVAMCKEKQGVFIPPSWMPEGLARAFAKELGAPVSDLN